jgi:hypothetical protein
MNYGLKDQRVGNLHANVVFVPKHCFNNSWMTTPWGCVNLMQYIQRLEQRIETLERQNLEQRIETLECQNLEQRIETLERQNLDRNIQIQPFPAPLVPPSAPPQDNDIIEIEGAVPETSS